MKPKKRSLTLNGHKTSVSLEQPFWEFFCSIAQKEEKSLNVLASEIDTSRDFGVGLATAIRLFCFNKAQKKNDPDL